MKPYLIHQADCFSFSRSKWNIFTPTCIVQWKVQETKRKSLSSTYKLSTFPKFVSKYQWNCSNMFNSPTFAPPSMTNSWTNHSKIIFHLVSWCTNLKTLCTKLTHILYIKQVVFHLPGLNGICLLPCTLFNKDRPELDKSWVNIYTRQVSWIERAK